MFCVSVCDITDLSDALLNYNNYAIYKDGTKLTDDNWSNDVFPGEKITLKCTKTATPWYVLFYGDKRFTNNNQIIFFNSIVNQITRL